jgi:hypothetical protein
MLRPTAWLWVILVFASVAATAQAETPEERTARLFAQKVKSKVDNCAKDKERAIGNIYSFHTSFDCNCLASELKALRSEGEFKSKKIDWRPCFDGTVLSQGLEKQCAYGKDCSCVSAQVLSALTNSDISMTANELPMAWMGHIMGLKTQAEAACPAKK